MADTHVFSDALESEVFVHHDDGSTSTIAKGSEGWDRLVAQGITPAAWVDPPATWDTVRGKRNQLLKATPTGKQVAIVTMSDAQTAYRKKLRDLPATNADPTKIVFPDAP
jgi:hypothetical protein